VPGHFFSISILLLHSIKHVLCEAGFSLSWDSVNRSNKPSLYCHAERINAAPGLIRTLMSRETAVKMMANQSIMTELQFKNWMC